MKLNDNEKKVLEMLKENPYANQKMIASKLNLSRPTIANLISSLQTKGYILGKPYVLKQENYVTCVGGANLDYIFRLEENMVLHTSNPVTSKKSYGGVVRNIADNLSRLNHQVSLMTIVGDDVSGRELIDYCKPLMHVFAVDYVKNKSTGSYYAVINPDGNMHIGYADMSINHLMNRDWILKHKRDLNLSLWIIADMNVSKEGLNALMEFSQLNDKKLAIVGVSGPKMKHLDQKLDSVELIICNLDESQSYLNNPSNDLKKHLALWLERGVKKIIITLGRHGAVFADQTHMGYQKAMPITKDLIVDVTGAGDAFSSATISALILEHSIDFAVKCGMVSAHLTLQSSYAVNKNISIDQIKKGVCNL